MYSDGFVSRAKQMVLDNLLNPQFGVSALARELGISRSELFRRIKAAEDKSASQFIREVRLDKAMELLKLNRYSINEIAYMVGFNSPTYFSTCFKEYFGYSPSTADQNGNHPLERPIDSTVKPRQLTIPLIAGAAAILVAVFGIFGMNGRGDLTSSNSVAVLKFDYLGTDSNQSAKAYMLADEVLNALSNLGNLKVVASSSSFQVDKSEPCSKIGKRLGVDYLVDGSLSDVDNQLKATVKLIDASTGHQLWARSFESEFADFQNLQREISAELTGKLENSILLEDGAEPAKNGITNFEAMDLYLRARKLGDHRYKDSIEQAIRLLEQAVHMEPNFAEGYGELSFLYGQLHFYGSVSKDERDKIMEKYLQKALELNPESPEVLFAKADFMFKTGKFVRDSSAIVSEFKRLHLANPNDARICYRLFQVYRSMGQYDTSHAYLEKSVQLEPQNSFYRTILARDLFWKRGQKDRAYAIIEEVTSKDRYHHSAVCFKTAMLVDQPQYGYLPAMEEIQKALDEEPYSDWYLYWGYQLALDLDLIPLASKYNNLYGVKFPENPIYTYGTLIKLFIAEQRFGDAIDITNIWVNDNRLDTKIAASNLARLHYLDGDFNKSLDILRSDFSGLFEKIEGGQLDPASLQGEEIEAIRTYIEVMRRMRGESGVHREFLCAYYHGHGDATNFGNKLYPLDCLYLQGDLKGFVQAMEETFYQKAEPFRIYTQLKTLRYREFEKYPEYQELYREIEIETHRMRAEVVTYLKEEGDWDPAWDAAMQ